MSRLRYGALLAPFLLYTAGCGGPALPRTYPATGTVTYKGGTPLTGGSVHLVAADDPLLRVVGAIGSDGRFTLHTIKDNAKIAGAPAGEFKVVVTPPLAANPKGGLKDPHSGVPPITLPRTFRVEAKENTFPIELPTAPPRP